MGEVIKAPHSFEDTPGPKVFLAGSIEMGEAIDWQDAAGKMFANSGVTVLSPRRDDFDASQPQTVDNDYFREQVEWELAGLEESDAIFMYFAPDTKSPICLLELGLFASSGKLLVCCPEGYWRKGNVDIVCRRYDVRQVDSIEEAVGEILMKVDS